MGKGIAIQTGYGQVNHEDIFLICTDGLNQFMQFQGVFNYASQKPNHGEQLFNELTQQVIKTDIAKDNVTLICIQVVLK